VVGRGAGVRVLGGGDLSGWEKRERLPKRLNPKNRIVSVFLDEPPEKCEKIRV
jgi:hypothetical protein